MRAYPKPDGMDGARGPDADEAMSVRMVAVEDYARSLLGILSQYVLPLILGLLGAVAYIVRRALFNLASNSYTPSFGGQFAMRLSLGGLLGVIGRTMLKPEARSSDPTDSGQDTKKA